MSRRTISMMTLASVGLGLLLYPTAANWFAVRDQASEIAGYSHAVDSMPGPEQKAMLARAEEYNQRLARGLTGIADSSYPEYRANLSPQPGDVMAELTIPSLELTLPVYHGTGDDSLRRGVGHLFGTSLPVGGEGTHATLSAHSGRIDADLFTRLEDLKLGGLFSIDVVGRRLVYKVEHIATVSPNDNSQLQLVPGEDYVTLLTCTPTGVNSHRLLVRGSRVEPVAKQQADEVIAGRNTDAGFPWWAVIFVGGVAAAWGVGRYLDRPRRAASAPHTEQGVGTDAAN